MKKIISAACIAILTISLLSSCTSQKQIQEPLVAEEPINIAVMKGPTGIGVVKLMDDNEKSASLNPYKFSIAGSPDEIVAGIVNGELDIAAVPANLASVLYNKTEGNIKVAAINTLGVLYIVETGNNINTITDLKGCTIYSTGKGATPEYSLNYILKQNGLDPESDVKIEYKTEATEVATILASTENAIAVLPEPFVTATKLKNDKLNVPISLGEEWKKINNEELVTGVIIVREEFLKNNSGVFETFVEEYRGSTLFVNEELETAAQLTGKYDIVPEAVAKQAIPKCNISFIDGENMKESISEYLNILYKQDPKSVGGKLPDDNFYYKK